MKKLFIVTVMILLGAFGVKAQNEMIDINFEIANAEATLDELKLEKDSIDKAYWDELRTEWKTLKTNECIITRVWNTRTLGYTDMHITYSSILGYVTIIVYHDDVVVKREKYEGGITNIPIIYKTGITSFRVEDPDGKAITIIRVSSN